MPICNQTIFYINYNKPVILIIKNNEGLLLKNVLKLC